MYPNMRVSASGQVTNVAGQPDANANAALSASDQMQRRANALMWISGIAAVIGAGVGVYNGLRR